MEKLVHLILLPMVAQIVDMEERQGGVQRQAPRPVSGGTDVGQRHRQRRDRVYQFPETQQRLVDSGLLQVFPDPQERRYHRARPDGSGW